MTRRSSSIDAGLGIGFIVSAVIHLTVFLLVTQVAALFPVAPSPQQVAYVDLVNLPVENPQAQAGAEQQVAAGETEPLESPVPATTQQPPAHPSPLTAKPGAAAPTPTVTQDDSEFTKRLSRLADTQESRRQQAVLDSLRSKQQVARSTVGVTSAKTGETGSDYTAYIQSRLKDAFRGTIKYSTKTPFVTIRLFIGTDGTLQRRTIIASSGDQELERAALDAVELAKEHFTPPPTRLWYEGQFMFKPEGISRPGVPGR